MVPIKRKTAAQLDAEIDAELKRHEIERGKRLAMMMAALKKSPALIVTDRYGHRDLLIRSGEMQNRAEGKLRVTMFATDGPRGHITRNTDKALAQELLQHYAVKSVRPATDAEVLSWTGTPAFARGAQHSAFTQASNMMRYLASQQGKGERAQEIERRAHDLVATDMDAAIAMLEAGVKEMTQVSTSTRTSAVPESLFHRRS
jgi:hypothetical protein